MRVGGGRTSFLLLAGPPTAQFSVLPRCHVLTPWTAHVHYKARIETRIVTLAAPSPPSSATAVNLFRPGPDEDFFEGRHTTHHRGTHQTLCRGQRSPQHRLQIEKFRITGTNSQRLDETMVCQPLLSPQEYVTKRHNGRPVDRSRSSPLEVGGATTAAVLRASVGTSMKIAFCSFRSGMPYYVCV